MYKKKKTYELEVHFGLLVLVVIMLCLNMFSNYVIHSTKNIVKDEQSNLLYKSSLAISRFIQNNQFSIIAESDLEQFRNKYGLDELRFVQTNQTKVDKISIQLLIKLLADIPPEQVPLLSRTILSSEFYQLKRGEDDNYYFVVPLQTGKRQNVLILSKQLDRLAYLDDASNTVVIITLVTIFVIGIIYLLLYRVILSPFKKLKENAKSAGRKIPKEDYEVGSVIQEYETIIHELKEKESELVTLHLTAKQRAESFEQFNDYLLGSMQAGIITIDKSGKILTINKSAEIICEINSSLYLDKKYSMLSFLSDEIVKKVNETLSDMKYHPYQEYKLQDSDKRVGLTISPVCDNDTHQIGASILINDISEIKKLQSELEKNRQMSALGEMSAGLAHQLRNSIGAITGYNQLMKRKLNQKNIEINTVDAIATELIESENLIRRFLNFTKPFDFDSEPTLLVPFVENIIDNLSVRSDFDLINIILVNNLPENSSLNIDPLLLKQALTNIIENSKNAYDETHGSIEIILDQTSKSCLISIQDTAGGITDENIDKIFTPFYSTNPLGTGLGLPLAQKIIVLHNGNLDVNSVVGQGSIFKISLPIETESIKDHPLLSIKNL